MGVLLQNDQPVGGISADVIESINFADLTTTSKTLPGAINELAANPSTTESMSQAEYNALTEAEKMDGTARFVYDAISTDESELWTRVGRQTLHTDAQIISGAINELKDVTGGGTISTTAQTVIGAINELNSNLANLFIIKQYTYSYSIPANGDATITPANFGEVVPSGYSNYLVTNFSSGNSNVYVRTARATGASYLIMHNITSGTIQSTCTIGIMYRKNIT